MKERLIQFLPSLVILVGIVVTISLYLAYFLKWSDRKDIADDAVWIAWVKTKKIRLMSLLAGILNLNIRTPIMEELIFRAPLIVVFSKLSGYAYLGLGLFGILFAVTHYFIPDLYFCDFDNALKRSKDLKGFGRELDQEIKNNRKIIRRIRILKVVLTFVLGVISGYFGIKYQSIYVSAGIHIGWNLLLPIIAGILTYLMFNFYWWIGCYKKQKACQNKELAK